MLKMAKKTAWWCPEWVSLLFWAGLKTDTVISEDSYTAYSVRKYNACMSDFPPSQGGSSAQLPAPVPQV